MPISFLPALGQCTLVMGILNVTPDSFSDGGDFSTVAAAAARAAEMAAEGADIIDVGGESTRPGARVASAAESPGRERQPVTEEQELRRVLPVIEALHSLRPDAVISVDTYKAGVAGAAVEAGAEIVNDVSAFAWDAGMTARVAALDCGAVLMHTRGRPHE